MDSSVLIDGDVSHKQWINFALSYLPDEILEKESKNLAIIGLGGIGGCRLPEQYRQREVIVISDWVFPPAGDSEGDTTGQVFIITLLHEIAHAVCRHKSPLFDKLTSEEIKSQEDEADEIAINWFNTHVKSENNKYLNTIQITQFREIINNYTVLCNDMEKYKSEWHKENGT